MTPRNKRARITPPSPTATPFAAPPIHFPSENATSTPVRNQGNASTAFVSPLLASQRVNTNSESNGNLEILKQLLSTVKELQKETRQLQVDVHSTLARTAALEKACETQRNDFKTIKKYMSEMYTWLKVKNAKNSDVSPTSEYKAALRKRLLDLIDWDRLYPTTIEKLDACKSVSENAGGYPNTVYDAYKKKFVKVAGEILTEIRYGISTSLKRTALLSVEEARSDFDDVIGHDNFPHELFLKLRIFNHEFLLEKKTGTKHSSVLCDFHNYVKMEFMKMTPAERTTECRRFSNEEAETRSRLVTEQEAEIPQSRSRKRKHLSSNRFDNLVQDQWASDDELGSESDEIVPADIE